MTVISPALGETYNLAVVSGGRPVLPRICNRSCSNKTVTCLTHDGANVIIPFNNQIKIMSIDTRNCVKTIKFGNNETLREVLISNEQAIVHITLGDAFRREETEVECITIFTSDGNAVVLNYRGKLIESPKIVKLGKLEAVEQVVKIFEKDGRLRVLTCTEERTLSYKYKLYAYEKDVLNLLHEFSAILLSAWSSNDEFLSLIRKNDESKRVVVVRSIFDDSLEKEIPLPTSSAATSSQSQFATVMAVDNQGARVAVGHASGVICVIEIADQTSRQLKWHIDSVLSLGFTQDGSYLLSGGWEKVLSLWQLSTNLQQFLPRLNGVIVDCVILGDKYYVLGLRLNNESSSDYQIILLNSTDLNSRVAVNGPLGVFNSMVKGVVQPVSLLTTKSSISTSSIAKSKKKRSRKLSKSKRQDFTAELEIHPVTKHLFLPHVSAVQTFDFYKNEQVSYQYLASGINNTMGKVRFELNLRDPEISKVKFTKNGKWMITHEIEYPSDGLLSSDDKSHTLKFWCQGENSKWVLNTKVLNPHPTITNILVAPSSIDYSEGCLTSDNNGGLKYWSFNKDLGSWSLTKVMVPNVNNFSNSVSLAWSLDGSLIFQAFDDRVTVIDFEEFQKFEEESREFLNEFIMDSAVQNMVLVNDINLVIATQTTLCCMDLLTGLTKNSFDLYPYLNGTYKNGHFGRLMALDERSGRIAVAVNQQHAKGDEVCYSAEVFVFDGDLSKQVGSFHHDDYIAGLRWNHGSDFIFFDIQGRLGVVSTITSAEILSEKASDSIFDSLAHNEFEIQLQNLKSDRQRKLAERTSDGNSDIQFEILQGNQKTKVINMNSFTSLFESIDNVQLDTFFDAVMRVVN
ncbi:LAMI_0H06502g1_1 [Lachancea mirantina]|uniref:LAMI_0H06502g1_1 n=1 Tax=Lachancea mirantina TaxID=1230905 RepID=A0A1G4KFH0_9SACH|nr:LAMI_0H06502g1_1 [Lachancea mirantina]